MGEWGAEVQRSGGVGEWEREFKPNKHESFDISYLFVIGHLSLVNIVSVSQITNDN